MEINEFLELNKKLDTILSKLEEQKDNRPPAVVKSIDTLGRVTIPKNIRKELNIQDGAKVNIYREDNKIILEI